MSTNTKIIFDVLNDEKLYFQFVLFMYYSEHVEDCHIEDVIEFSNRLLLIKDDIIKSHDNPQISDPFVLQTCIDNTFELIWDNEQTFMVEYLLWVETTHTIEI